MNIIGSTVISGKRSPLQAGLWLAQGLLAGAYLSAGIAALVLPAARVSTIAPWVNHLPGAVLIFVCAADLAAGVGVLLPSVTRIAPALSVTAAFCSAVLQVCAIFFRAVLGTPETMLPVSVTLFALSAFVAWGRSDPAPIASRWQDRRMAAFEVSAEGLVDGSDGRIERRRHAITRRRKSERADFAIRRSVRAAPPRRAKQEETVRRDRPSSIRH